MSFDGVFTRAMVKELNRDLENGRISKVYQPFQHEIILTIRANRKNKRVLLSAHPSYARIQVINDNLSNPDSAPNFCMVLRKNLEGAYIEDIKQLGNDRIIIFSFRNFDELGDQRQMELIIELMGRHSNIFLIDKQTRMIIDCLKHVPFYQNSFRPLHPGVAYQLPPHQDKANPFEMEKEELASVAATFSDELPLFKSLQGAFQGLGSDSAMEISYHTEQDGLSAADAILAFKQQLDTAIPTLTEESAKKQHFTPFPFRSLPGEQRHYDSLSELLDAYYDEKASRDRINQVASELLHIVNTERKKNQLKLKKLDQTLLETEKADVYRIKGEILTAYLHQMKKGDMEVTLNNFYDDENPITIALNPALTPSQNAQKYFSKYQKLTTAVAYVNEQVEHTHAENEYLESIETLIQLSDPQDLEDIKDELRESGYLKKKYKGKQKKHKTSKPHKFLSSDGTTILIGKNNVQNDQLTLKTAKKSDIWLHTKNIPGSHVIIESNHPSEETLFEAASLAAYYSKFQNSSNVPVDYVAVKNIRKPNGAKPGFVIYEGQKTLYVTPDKELVRTLKAD